MSWASSQENTMFPSALAAALWDWPPPKPLPRQLLQAPCPTFPGASPRPGLRLDVTAPPRPIDGSGPVTVGTAAWEQLGAPQTARAAETTLTRLAGKGGRDGASTGGTPTKTPKRGWGSRRTVSSSLLFTVFQFQSPSLPRLFYNAPVSQLFSTRTSLLSPPPSPPPRGTLLLRAA